MERSATTSGAQDSDHHSKDLSPDQALEAWKHFASTGGVDKERMVTIATWLLAFSASIFGYVVTQLFDFASFTFNNASMAAFLASVGTFVSFVGGYVVLLYAAYANWNWRRADEIAAGQGWTALLPEPRTMQRSALLSVVEPWGKPHDPTKRLAPVFHLFLGLAAGSFVVHGTLLLLSLARR